MTQLHKIVDGVKVPLTPEEIADFNAKEAEFAANEVKRLALRYLQDVDAMSGFSRNDEETVKLLEEAVPAYSAHQSVLDVLEEKQFYRDFLSGSRTSKEELLLGAKEFEDEKIAGTRAVKARLR